MKVQLLSWVERLVPRVTSAALLFGLALFAGPSQVGVFAWGVLGYTFYQAITEVAARHVAVPALGHVAGRHWLVRYSRRSATFAPLFLLPVFLGLLLTTPRTPLVTILALSPLAFAPVFTAWGLSSQARLQATDRWRVLALAQLGASAIAAVVSIPTLILTQSIVGPALHVVLVEAFVALIARRWAARAPLPEPSPGRSDSATYRQMAIYSGLAWIQGQGDRLLLGVIAGVAALGVFSTASAVARSLSDTLAASTANVVRSQLFGSDISAKSSTEAILWRACLFAAALSVAVLVINDVVLARFVSAEWSEILAIVPILSLAAIPSVLSWSGTVILSAQSRGRRTLVSPIVGLAFAPLVAVLATSSLPSAAWLVVLREYVVASTSFGLAGGQAPWRTFAKATGLLVALCATVWMR